VTLTDRLAAHWVAGALYMAAALLVLVPLLAGAWGLPLLLIYLHAPAYMLHQGEEHVGDRFRRFVNARMFGGVEALTTRAVLWINLGGAWGVSLAALYAAWAAGPGFGLAAPYLVVVNALTHIVGAVRLRAYNPGLWTSCFPFLPLGLATLLLLPATVLQHLLGLAVALAIHAAIVVHVRRRAARLRVVPAGLA